MKLLCTSDWHFRMDTPICRVDDNFFELQKRIINQIYQIAIKEDCLVIIAGDIFDRGRPDKAQTLESFLTKIFITQNTAFIAGNHDLLYHQIKYLFDSSIGVLEPLNCKYSRKKQIDFYNFGEEIQTDKKGIAVIHKYVDEKSVPEFMSDGVTADYLLEESFYDIIISGDNHHGFVYEKDGRLVINPGCITRQTADMKYYKPFVVLLDTETREYSKIFLDDNDENLVTDVHLVQQQQREDRISSFVEKLKGVIDLNLSFEDNVEKYCLENNINDDIKLEIFKSFKGVG